MASSTASNFLGTQIFLSPPTPKTTKSLPRKFLVPQSILGGKKSNSISQSLKDIPSKATLAALLFSSINPRALAVDNTAPPTLPPVIQAEAPQPSPSNPSPFSQNLILNAPQPQAQPSTDLPEGSQWRYSEFLNAVKKGKVERVRFGKDGSALQLTAVDGRRATVIVPNDPDLIDILAMNGVDISVSEGDSGNGLFNFIGNLLFPFLAFAGLFFLFRRAQGGPGGPGGLGGPMDFGRSKSKFQEVPETGVDDFHSHFPNHRLLHFHHRLLPHPKTIDGII
ncbi:ATP-dependent zinc metalloprotease FTSH, chloroplastic-like [Coffea arabica]|uniref:ATP-dependent zinc metalloprotease FTSH, chloroplastic-like n=1 Tax=Coffea arabica TaxID=13443 RepID=A0A6P6T974_COFAR|nr:ATP-dependent zinc metalloprotease FTSH, chloroplastic-like [Coffea arabica]